MSETLARYDKNAVYIGLQHRGISSLAPHRQRLNRSAFHWSLLVRDASALHRFDVTDGIVTDPETGENLNRDEIWIHRHITSTNTISIARYLGAVKVGKLKRGVKIDQVAEVLGALDVPDKDPEKKTNCVTWSMAGMHAIQEHGLVERFDIEEAIDRGLRHGDERIADCHGTSEVVVFMKAESSWRGLVSKVWK